MLLSEFSTINEAFASDIDIHRNNFLEEMINAGLGDKIAPAHTRAFTTPHLEKQDIHVLSLFSHQHGGHEYHIMNGFGYPDPTARVDRKSMSNIMNIIRKDSVPKLRDGKRVIFQTVHDGQHEHYKNFAKRLADHTGRTATDVGSRKLTSMDAPANTIVIEQTLHSKMPESLSGWESISLAQHILQNPQDF